MNDSLGELLLQGILTKITRGSRIPGTGSLSEGFAQYKDDYDFRGVFEEYREGVVDRVLIQDGDRKVIILAKSIQVKPEIGDKVVLEEETFRTIINVKRDPAGATFICQVR